MDPFSTLSATLQVIAAFLIFVAGYLVIIVSAILCLVIAEIIYERSSMNWEYGVKPASMDTRVLSETGGEIRRSGRQRLALRF